MTLLETIRKFFSARFSRKKRDPVYANCAMCGERVYLPYHCHYCDQYYCGEHRLPFAHDCRNIDVWKNRPSPGGPATGYLSGKVRVKK